MFWNMSFNADIFCITRHPFYGTWRLDQQLDSSSNTVDGLEPMMQRYVYEGSREGRQCVHGTTIY